MPAKTIELTMNVQDLYKSKRCSAADALEHLRDGDFIIVPTGVGEPPSLLTELSEQRRRWSDIKVGQILAVRKFAYFDTETVDHVRHVAFFFGAASRAGGIAGWTDFIPSYFSEMPSLIERGQMAADVVMAMASAPMWNSSSFSRPTAMS